MNDDLRTYAPPEGAPDAGAPSDEAPAYGTHAGAPAETPEPQPETWFWGGQEPEPPAEGRAPRRGRAVVAWFLAAVLGAGAGSATTYLALRDGSTTGGGTRLVSPPVTDQIDVPSNQAALVAKEVMPSIVQVSVASQLGQTGSGSGVIYTDDGYVVTNLHVVNGASEIRVGLPDGRTLPATVAGTGSSAGIDLAVLKVEATGLKPATWGSTSTLAVGDLAVAIGSPFGLDATVTSGIISALHRNREEVNVRDAIQTDAPINPGNSGGALANARGEVIGINTAILSPGAGVLGGQGGNVGIGFAIPSEIVRNVADQIIEGKTAQLAYLGIEGSSMPGRKGARVGDVGEGTPAATAGLKAGDVIVSANGTPIGGMDELISFLIAQKVGTQVDLGVERDGKRITLKATLAARPPEG